LIAHFREALFSLFLFLCVFVFPLFIFSFLQNQERHHRLFMTLTASLNFYFSSFFLEKDFAFQFIKVFKE